MRTQYVYEFVEGKQCYNSMDLLRVAVGQEVLYVTTTMDLLLAIIIGLYKSLYIVAVKTIGLWWQQHCEFSKMRKLIADSLSNDVHHFVIIASHVTNTCADSLRNKPALISNSQAECEWTGG